MRASIASIAAFAVTLLVAGCAYRMAAPPALGERVRIAVRSNDARLVRVQAYLQSAVARAVQDRLGWTVSPDGSARLDLAIAEEEIDSTVSDARNIPVRWRITVQGTAALTSARGHAVGTFVGAGYASGLAGEADALSDAADKAAAEIAVWLERTTGEWK